MAKNSMQFPQISNFNGFKTNIVVVKISHLLFPWSSCEYSQGNSRDLPHQKQKGTKVAGWDYNLTLESTKDCIKLAPPSQQNKKERKENKGINWETDCKFNRPTCIIDD